jgi:RHS repeat-associated protein
VWRWDHGEPFGNDVPNNNPSGLGAFDFPLRLPGQYYDRETALHYNMFRDYDPSIGRYVESDPIGLKGGIHTYAYVLANPLMLADQLGLAGGLTGPFTSIPPKIAAEVCAAKITCPYWNRFGYQAVYEQCQVLNFEVQGKWQRECEDICADKMRKKCNPPSACVPSDTGNG